MAVKEGMDGLLRQLGRQLGLRRCGARSLIEHFLQILTEKDRKIRLATISLDYDIPADTPETMTLKAVRSERFLGPVSGGVQVRWTGDTMEAHVANLRMSEATITVTRPAAYLIPAARGDIAEILRRHGIVVSQLEQTETWPVEIYHLPEAKMAAPKPFTPNPFEGHLRITPGAVSKESREQTFAAGTYRVDTDQALGELAVLLLEPESPDSLFQWGFFLGMLNRTEYTEGYVMEPMAQQMLEDDPALARSFQKKLIDDAEFAGDASARLDWFYERTPYYDKAYLVYPVARMGR